MPAEIVFDKVCKSYNEVLAVNKVSFRVEKGEIFGLIGPDGAGKTTLLRMLVTLLSPDSGEIFFQSRQITTEINFVRSNIGYMPQRFSLYQDLSVEQNLDFFGDLYGVPAKIQASRKQRLYDFSRLQPFKSRKAGALSGGMKQKLALSCMLMHEPEVIILDEPTYGVDPVSRNEFWEILHELQGRGVTMIVSTPYMEEAADCSRVGFIFDGKLLGVNVPQQFVADFKSPLFLIKAEHPHKIFQSLSKTEFKDEIQLFGEGLHLLDKNNKGQNYIQELLSGENMSIKGIDPKLEDVFLDLLNSKRDHHG